MFFLVNRFKNITYMNGDFFMLRSEMASSLWSADVVTMCGLPRLIWRTCFLLLKHQTNRCMLCIFLSYCTKVKRQQGNPADPSPSSRIHPWS